MASRKDIPKRIQTPNYRITVDLDGLPHMLERYTKTYNLEMCPDFQRGHVWTQEQQVAFVEYLLSGGVSGLEIYFNTPGWMGNGPAGTMELVDGLQRLTAILKFINNEIAAFGYFLKDFEDADALLRSVEIFFNMNNLRTRAEVLRWYLEMNSGGTPHAPEEIARVTELFKAAVKEQN